MIFFSASVQREREKKSSISLTVTSFSDVQRLDRNSHLFFLNRNSISFPSVHGPGYAWNPKRVVIREGDSVKWEWTKNDPLSQLMYNVFQTSSGAAYEYDGSGFNSGSPTSAGGFLDFVQLVDV